MMRPCAFFCLFFLLFFFPSCCDVFISGSAALAGIHLSCSPWCQHRSCLLQTSCCGVWVVSCKDLSAGSPYSFQGRLVALCCSQGLGSQQAGHGMVVSSPILVQEGFGGFEGARCDHPSAFTRCLLCRVLSPGYLPLESPLGEQCQVFPMAAGACGHEAHVSDG